MRERPPLSAIQMLRSDGEAQHVTSLASRRASKAEVRGPAGGRHPATGGAGPGTATGGSRESTG